MLFVVEVKVLDIDQEILGAWGRYYAVPMQFEGDEIRFWGGDWSIKCEFVSSRSKLHSVCLFILRPNVADDAEICDLGVLGGFVPVDENASVSYLYVPDSLETLSNLV